MALRVLCRPGRKCLTTKCAPMPRSTNSSKKHQPQGLARVSALARFIPQSLTWEVSALLSKCALAGLEGNSEHRLEGNRIAIFGGRTEAAAGQRITGKRIQAFVNPA